MIFVFEMLKNMRMFTPACIFQRQNVSTNFPLAIPSLVAESSLQMITRTLWTMAKTCFGIEARTASKQTQHQQKNNVNSNRFECVHNRKCIAQFDEYCERYCASSDGNSSSNRNWTAHSLGSWFFHERYEQEWKRVYNCAGSIACAARFSTAYRTHPAVRDGEWQRDRESHQHTQSVVCRYNTFGCQRLDQN